MNRSVFESAFDSECAWIGLYLNRHSNRSVFESACVWTGVRIGVCLNRPVFEPAFESECVWIGLCLNWYSSSTKFEFIFFITIQKKKNLKDRHFRKEYSFFRFENYGKYSWNFWKCNSLTPFIHLEEKVYKFSARLLKNSTQKRLPQNNYFTQKVSLPKKNLPRKRSCLKIVSLSKKVSLPENVSLPKKCFTWKIWLTQKSF